MIAGGQLRNGWEVGVVGELEGGHPHGTAVAPPARVQPLGRWHRHQGPSRSAIAAAAEHPAASLTAPALAQAAAAMASLQPCKQACASQARPRACQPRRGSALAAAAVSTAAAAAAASSRPCRRQQHQQPLSQHDQQLCQQPSSGVDSCQNQQQLLARSSLLRGLAAASLLLAAGGPTLQPPPAAAAAAAADSAQQVVAAAAASVAAISAIPAGQTRQPEEQQLGSAIVWDQQHVVTAYAPLTRVLRQSPAGEAQVSDARVGLGLSGPSVCGAGRFPRGRPQGPGGTGGLLHWPAMLVEQAVSSSSARSEQQAMAGATPLPCFEQEVVDLPCLLKLRRRAG